MIILISSSLVFLFVTVSRESMMEHRRKIFSLSLSFILFILLSREEWRLEDCDKLLLLVIIGTIIYLL